MTNTDRQAYRAHGARAMTPPEKNPKQEAQGQTPQGEIRLGVGVSIPEHLLEFTFSSSSGPGGQNVNRRSTKVRLRISLADLPLRPSAARRLRTIAASQITDAGDVIITCDTSRSQRANKDECLDRLKELVAKSMVAPKPRKPTKPSRGAVERRLKAKRIQSDRKARRRPNHDE